MQTGPKGRPILWTVFLVSALAAIALFFIPAYVIRPFTHQSEAGLNLAMAIRARAPWGTLIAAAVALVSAYELFRTGSWWRRSGIIAVMVLVMFSTVMARLNYFEWMFRPVSAATFDSAETSKLASSEMVLAVHEGGDARAYPISQMAYHHILNDVVGGVPIAATY